MRADTPGCDGRIFFDSAGSSLMPAAVHAAVTAHLERELEVGGYRAAKEAQIELDRLYEAAACLLGSRPDEIAFVENATRAWDMAFYALPIRRGERILADVASYGSTYLALLQVARRTGARIVVVPNNGDGQVDVERLGALLEQPARVVSVTHVPTNGGLVNPVVKIGDIVRETDAVYIVDGCQSAGQLPLHVGQIGCDFLSTTGRKYLRGPRGTGLLYARREIFERLEPPFLDIRAAEWVSRNEYVLRPDARRFETWESNLAGKRGLAAAIDYALALGFESIWARIRELAATLRRELARLPGVQVHDLGTVRCGIVTFSVEGIGAEQAAAKLWERGAVTAVSEIADSRLDMEARGLEQVVRASVHYFNTEDEVEEFCGLVAGLKAAA